ncbi:hypothetical protein RJ55_08636 [Drechmeria coniospora]|nr:hypothetical protein RJ55_08636 [Drechmeria coniospora]
MQNRRGSWTFLGSFRGNKLHTAKKIDYSSGRFCPIKSDLVDFSSDIESRDDCPDGRHASLDAASTSRLSIDNKPAEPSCPSSSSSLRHNAGFDNKPAEPSFPSSSNYLRHDGFL